jgi:hypothetical protein
MNSPRTLFKRLALPVSGSEVFTIDDDFAGATAPWAAGGGGGGAYWTLLAGYGGSGGSGIVIVRYALSQPLVITTSSLANGQGGSAYSQTLAATGGVAPYSWSLASGALPVGITLASNGTLSGTPTAFGAFNFTAQVADNASVITTKAFTLTIVNPDANANNIPDAWEIQYFGSTDNPNGVASFDADGDGDGDGLTNLSEYLAGTSPTDPASKLQVAITSVSPSGAVLRFPPSPGGSTRSSIPTRWLPEAGTSLPRPTGPAPEKCWKSPTRRCRPSGSTACGFHYRE